MFTICIIEIGGTSESTVLARRTPIWSVRQYPVGISSIVQHTKITGGKIATEVVVKRTKTIIDDSSKEKTISQHIIIDTASQCKVHEPYGVKGMGPIAFGGGGDRIPSKTTQTVASIFEWNNTTI